ncbi:MAG: ATP-dependent DNA helicase RecQ [Candidatus Pacebacteria bacterium]|nr:ATP-dependent DNA helicase RecQ [Candidatus Paceibacterota bacterium]
MDKQIKKTFKINSFRSPQLEIITSIQQKNNTLALLPTGYGKSICYQIPGLKNYGYTLVISPLVALMDDQVFHLQQKGINAIAIHSNKKPNQQIFLENFKRNYYKFIYLSPEKLILSKINQIFWSKPPALVAVDEAHCFSIWGNNFRPIYKQLPNYIFSLQPPPTIALFTATASKKVVSDLKTSFHIKNDQIFIGNFFRKNLFIIHKKFFLRSQRFLYLCYLIFHKYQNKNGLIYCLTRKEVESVFNSIKQLDFFGQLKIEFFHAGINKNQKQKIISDFIKNKIKVLVTTNAFGMGIDKSDLEFVIHQQLPERLENYVQEIGRAGRNGQLAFCELLIHDFDFQIQKNLNKKTKNNNQMKKFIHSKNCHHQKILNFFGQKTDVNFNCTVCDICSPHSEIFIQQLRNNISSRTDTFINQQKYLFNYKKYPQFFKKYISVGTGQSKMC